ncbi:addiction module antidote protein, HigA family [Caviibacterium pharyngocola]|uniref:Addiction module antidote protein, HigA family n=2 Tax=Caviibacterium pharyngocola TaxID=28159 RepID=A0A2M8RV57_9PAST|nr:addiction module antidote protein, HigA family [Caviibacterium pharyngocola]
MFNPAHPGKVLKDVISEFQVNDVAEKLGITRVTLSRILNGETNITPEMALRLSKLLPNTTPNFWLGMQVNYDLWHLEQSVTFDIEPLYQARSREELNNL